MLAPQLRGELVAAGRWEIETWDLRECRQSQGVSRRAELAQVVFALSRNGSLNRNHPPLSLVLGSSPGVLSTVSKAVLVGAIWRSGITSRSWIVRGGPGPASARTGRVRSARQRQGGSRCASSSPPRRPCPRARLRSRVEGPPRRRRRLRRPRRRSATRSGELSTNGNGRVPSPPIRWSRGSRMLRASGGVVAGVTHQSSVIGSLPLQKRSWRSSQDTQSTRWIPNQAATALASSSRLRISTVGWLGSTGSSQKATAVWAPWPHSLRQASRARSTGSVRGACASTSSLPSAEPRPTSSRRGPNARWSRAMLRAWSRRCR